MRHPVPGEHRVADAGPASRRSGPVPGAVVDDRERRRLRRSGARGRSSGSRSCRSAMIGTSAYGSDGGGIGLRQLDASSWSSACGVVGGASSAGASSSSGESSASARVSSPSRRRPRASMRRGERESDRRSRDRCRAARSRRPCRRAHSASRTHSPSSASTVSTSASTAGRGSTSAIARFGSFSPWPVTVHTTSRRARPDRRPRAWSSPATDAADAGSTNTPSCDGEQPVGVEDLGVGDRADRAARLVAGRDRAVPARRVADPDRGGDRLGCSTGSPSTSGAAPAACQPSMRGGCVARAVALRTRA